MIKLKDSNCEEDKNKNQKIAILQNAAQSSQVKLFLSKDCFKFCQNFNRLNLSFEFFFQLSEFEFC